MDEDGVPDTRVYVSGLPPSLTSEQLGAHFAGRYQITDAVVLPGRRIGFVGFRNYTLAKNAVKYFDKSYIRLSKISVEMARPVEFSRDGAQPLQQTRDTTSSNPLHFTSHSTKKTDSKTTSAPNSAYEPSPSVAASPTANKRKREQQDGVEDALEGAKRDRKSLTKKGDKGEKKKESSETRSTGISEPSSTSIVDDPSLSSDKKKSKKRKEKDRTSRDPENEEINEGVQENKKDLERKKRRNSKNDHIATGGDGPSENEETHALEDAADLRQQKGEKSDSDWLRAKTSRTLDLVDADDAIISPTKNNNAKDFDLDSRDEQEDEGDHSAKVDGELPHASIENGRLFVRNLSYTTEELDLQKAFSKYGKISEIHLVKDFKTSSSKGIAYIQFTESQSAENALSELDGRPFQGRLLHILPASDKRTSKLDEFELSKLPVKKQKELKRKREASTASFSWNSLYMNPDAVLSSIADRLGVSKSELLDPTSADAAVKQAHAETDTIQRTRESLRQHGVNMDAFKNRARDDRSILLKNFPFQSNDAELKELLVACGEVSRLILPGTGILCIVQFKEAQAASQALKQLSYRNFKGSLLYLEKAPQGLFDSHLPQGANSLDDEEIDASLDKSVAREEMNTSELPSSTIFVRNLNFTTTNDRLSEIFRPLAGFLSARVKTKTDPKRPGEILSMGYGFVEFATKQQAEAAIAAMNGYKLENHQLLVRASHKAIDAAEEKRRDDLSKRKNAKKTKIIIKNLPFEASKKDIRSLFGAYGQLRSVRVPKKFDNTARGFAFADFVTTKEAENAMESLSNTHLLGRRLVLEFAESESVDAEEEIRAIEKKVGKQTTMIHLNNVTGSARRKFNVDTGDDTRFD